ncbi:MAG: M20/M25/M40 family metallo-hydrolase [Verrucomicrobia bacterium]|nr:M20/M25/M40 family metallo-hydrolase [Verrucomicrobiota bacterium]
MPVSAHKLLRELIALPSVNPAFLPGRDDLTGDRRVADFLAFTADRAGLELEWQEVFPGRSNLLIRLTPAGGKVRRRILLAPHMDTVGVDGEARFKPVVKAGQLHGRGACDTKGSIATYLAALLELAATGERPRETEIVLAALVDEENNQSGSRALVGSLVGRDSVERSEASAASISGKGSPRKQTRFAPASSVGKWGSTESHPAMTADLAIVGEPTLCKVITAHKGDLWLRLTTHGKSAHGSKPHLGKNAVHAMARVVEELETNHSATLKRRTHPLLGHATVNVGFIAGGKQPNIVPDRCEILIDRRTLPGESDAGVFAELRALLRRLGVDAELTDTKNAPCPALETDPNLPLVRQLTRRAGQRRALGVDYFSDAAVLASGGIPSVLLGPGDIAQAHTADEWVELAQLERLTRLLVKFLREQP